MTSAPGAVIFADPSADPEIVLAEGFARRLGQLAASGGAPADAIDWVERAAFAVSRATANGHVCLSLAALAQRHHAPIGAVRAALRASGLVCEGCAEIAATALLPLVVDAEDRLYLARYYDYERRLAHALAARVGIEKTDHRLADLAAQRAHFPIDWQRDPPAQAGQIALQAAGEQAADQLGNALARDGGSPVRLPVHGSAANGAAGAAALDWQQVAAAFALSNRLTIISGGPGTGKTTTVAVILACLLKAAPNLRIALAAPTGKAAQRICEALAERAAQLAQQQRLTDPSALAAQLPATSFTLHRLLGYRPRGGFRHHRGAPLPYEVVIVDEASMIDVALAAQLAEAIAPDARLILLGDKDQLAAVEAGAVFAELSAQPALSAQRAAALASLLGITAASFVAKWPAPLSHAPAETPAHRPAARTPSPLTDCVVWLERNYRFGLDSPIGRLSSAIRAGSPEDTLAALSSGAPETVLLDDGGPALSAATLAQLAAGYLSYLDALLTALTDPAAWRDAKPLSQLFSALNRYRVLCALRAGPRGVDYLNAQLAASVRCALPARQRGTAWFAGRPVMVTRNDYTLELFNGDIGITLPSDPDSRAWRVAFITANGDLRIVTAAALPPHKTAFALTVHQSQGSEFDQVAIVLPATATRVLTRELVYTAVTRAKQTVILVSAPTQVAQAVATPTVRASGLSARLNEIAASNQFCASPSPN